MVSDLPPVFSRGPAAGGRYRGGSFMPSSVKTTGVIARFVLSEGCREDYFVMFVRNFCFNVFVGSQSTLHHFICSASVLSLFLGEKLWDGISRCVPVVYTAVALWVRVRLVILILSVCTYYIIRAPNSD